MELRNRKKRADEMYRMYTIKMAQIGKIANIEEDVIVQYVIDGRAR